MRIVTDFLCSIDLHRWRESDYIDEAFGVKQSEGVIAYKKTFTCQWCKDSKSSEHLSIKDTDQAREVFKALSKIYNQ